MRKNLDLDAGDPIAEQRILDQRLAPFDFGPRILLQPPQQELAHTDTGNVRALVTQQVLGDGPALILLAHPVLDGDLYVVEEYVIDVVTLIECTDGPHLQARCLHVDQQERDALLWLSFRRGPHQAEEPRGPLGKAGPRLLSVHYVVIALTFR